MNHLLRDLAPLTAEAWEVVDTEARTRLTELLAARKLVDFAGPHGWQRSAIELGSVEVIDAPDAALAAKQRRVQPLVELRASFTVPRSTLEDIARGRPDPDLDTLAEAVRAIAQAENTAVFHGYAAAGITGLTEASSQSPITLGDDYGDYPTSVAKAINALRLAGIVGPFGLAIGPDGYTGIVETAENGGYPLIRHLHEILGGPLVWAPGVTGAVLVSTRGGDFQFDSGQDLSIGYRSHDADEVELYLEESFTFRVLEPDAAVALV
jgi:uncharacterized linocin/CFP29 family protein